MSRSSATETVVVGAGQAGIALSRELTLAGRPHVVLERARVGQRWRSRWDSLTLLSPAWASTLPGQAQPDDEDAFLTRDAFVEGLERHAESFAAPVVEGVTVRAVRQARGGFAVTTTRGAWTARNVVIATGDCDVPHVPALAAGLPVGVVSLPSSRYVAPDLLPHGNVLVVGAGPTGQQLALELARSGKSVTLAVGRHARLPRKYRGRDVWRWIAELGDFDVSIDDVPDPEAARRTPSVSLTGANGGEQLDLDVLRRAGVDLVGRLEGFDGARALFGSGLRSEVEDADRRMHRLLGRMDVLADSLGAPARDPIRAVEIDRVPAALDLRDAGVSVVLWATGFRRSYPWLRVPVLDGRGELVHRHGVTPAPGLFALGLKFQRRRRSHFIDGVGEDAAFLAERIVARARGKGAIQPRSAPARMAGPRGVAQPG